MKADLHLHSVFSDGAFTPSELVGLLRKKDVKIASLADHDSIRGLRQFAKFAKRSGIYAIPAVELSCQFRKKEIHILGYCIDFEQPSLLKKLEEFRQKRKTRMGKMMNRLKDLGFKIEAPELKEFSKKGLFGRMHLALALVKKGYCRSVAESFARFLGHGKPAFIPKDRFEPEEAIDLVKKAGGIPVIAHPGSPKLKDEEIYSLISMGIKGLEAVHPKHSNSMQERIKRICLQKTLLLTGGSDFHGFEKQEFDNLGSKCVNLLETCNLNHLLKATGFPRSEC